MSVGADTVAAHEQRSGLGRHRRQQVPAGSEESTNPTTVLIAEGLTALAEAIRELDLQVEEHRREVTAPN
jgi:uncharacterized protein YegL